MKQSQQTRWNRLKDARKRREHSSKCACASKQPPAGEVELLDKAETPQHTRTHSNRDWTAPHLTHTDTARTPFLHRARTSREEQRPAPLKQTLETPPPRSCARAPRLSRSPCPRAAAGCRPVRGCCRACEQPRPRGVRARARVRS
eukprot:2293310-Pleurochrysis_carterae.AAC.1